MKKLIIASILVLSLLGAIVADAGGLFELKMEIESQLYFIQRQINDLKSEISQISLSRSLGSGSLESEVSLLKSTVSLQSMQIYELQSKINGLERKILWSIK